MRHFRRALSNAWISNRQSAFTLIELMVAVGLMAILLTMIAAVFFQATQSFRVARASLEIHQEARAALQALVQDLSAAEYCTYGGGVKGYFVISAATAANGQEVPVLTFTTLAPQPGARYAAPEAVQQLALVRYMLEWEGTSATIRDTQQTRPLYRLVKRVRFPRTDDPNLNMDEFVWQNLTMEYDPADANRSAYAQAEPIAFNVLSMQIRVFCGPDPGTNLVEGFVDFGTVDSAGNLPAPYLQDAKNWTNNQHDGRYVRIVAGYGADQPNQPRRINTTTAPDLLVLDSPPPATRDWNPIPNTTSQYRIERTFTGPAWFERGSYTCLGFTKRPPTLVEVTLEMTDRRALRFFTFTQRFYVPASESP